MKWQPYETTFHQSCEVAKWRGRDLSLSLMKRREEPEGPFLGETEEGARGISRKVGSSSQGEKKGAGM